MKMIPLLARTPLLLGCVLGMLMFTAGCGQTGPLYLPDNTQAAEKTTK